MMHNSGGQRFIYFVRLPRYRMYNRIKQALEEYGELMLMMDSGDVRELHLHNTNFLDEPMARIDTGDEKHWVDLSKVERYWIHYDF